MTHILMIVSLCILPAAAGTFHPAGKGAAEIFNRVAGPFSTKASAWDCAHGDMTLLPKDKPSSSQGNQEDKQGFLSSFEPEFYDSSADEHPEDSAPAIKLKVTAEIANIRVKPSIGSNIVRQFSQGEIIEAVRKEGEWFLVKLEPDETGVVSGYVHESLVLAIDDIPAEAGTVKPAVKPDPKIEILPPPKIDPVKDVPEKPARLPVETKRPETVSPIAAKPVDREPSEETALAAEAVHGMYLSIWGGGGLSAIGDLNTGAQGLADFYAAQINKTADQTISPARAGLQFGGEFGIPISPGFFLAIGAEYLFGAKESVLAFSPNIPQAGSFKVKPRFSTLPVYLSLVYYPVEYFYVKAGAGYFFAQANYQYLFTYDKTIRDWQGGANAQGLGLLGGIGFVLSFGERFGLIAEVNGRYAQLTGFKGTGTFLEEGMTEPINEEGRLYAFDSRTSSQTSYPQVFIRSKTPAEGGVENAREAKVDLSGISIRVGVKVKF